jgi:hypothetical protein
MLPMQDRQCRRDVRRRRNYLFAAVWVLVCISATVSAACSYLVAQIKAGPQFRLHVTDRGAPVVGARYELRKMDAPTGDPVAVCLTDSGGFANFTNLQPGMYRLGGKSDPFDHRAIIDVSDDSKTGTTVEWTLPESNPIVVRSATGTLIGQDFYPTMSQSAFSLALLDVESGEEIKVTTSDYKGRFSFGPDVPNGRYFLRLSNNQIPYGGRVLIEIRPGAKYPNLDLDLTWPDCIGLLSAVREDREPIETTIVCGSVQGVDGWPIVQSLDGQPVPAHVYLFKGRDDPVVAAETTTDPKGKFQFNSQVIGVYRLVVLAPFAFEVPFVQMVRIQPGNSNDCAKPILAKLQQPYR